MRDGFSAVYIDVPAVSISNNLDYLRSNIHPYLIPIERKNIINWRVENVNGCPQLTKVVLKEERLEDEGEYGSVLNTYYRVLSPGAYKVIRLEKDKDDEWQQIVIEEGSTSLNVILLVYYPTHTSDLFAAHSHFLELVNINL